MSTKKDNKEKEVILKTMKNSDIKNVDFTNDYDRNVSWFPSGVFSVDWNIGGGIPLGKIIEIFGEESSGKSLLCTVIAAAVIKSGGIVVMFDKEMSFDPEFAKQNGLDPNDESFIYINDVDLSLEHIYAYISKMSSQVYEFDKPVLIFWDSIEATPSNREIEQAKKGDFGSHEQGSHRAQVNSKALRQIYSSINGSKMSLIVVNQVREKVGVTFGSKINTSGGRAYKFYASIRVYTHRTKINTDKNGKKIGITCNIESIKNKVSQPFRLSTFELTFVNGFSDTKFLLDIACDLGIVQKKNGGWYVFKENRFQSPNFPEDIINSIKDELYATKEWYEKQ